jgi:hypothetical protein
MLSFKNKYLKYKIKYLNLKKNKLYGGSPVYDLIMAKYNEY